MKKLILVFLIFKLVFANCWKDDEKMDIEMAEMGDNLVLSFKSAVDCKAVSNAKVKVKISGFNPVSLKTDNKGYLYIPKAIIENINDGYMKLDVYKKGFIKYHIKLDILLGSLWKKYFLLSPRLKPKSVRFVLSWDKDPADLDLHLVTNSYHISYRNKKSIDGVAYLDQDATNGYGAETITLEKVDDNITYNLYVKKYSGNGSIDRKTKIAVYIDNRLDKIISLNSGDVIKVLELKDGEIKYINKSKRW